MARVRFLAFLLMLLQSCESKNNGSNIPQDGQSAPVTTYPLCSVVEYRQTCRKPDGNIYYVPNTDDSQMWMLN